MSGVASTLGRPIFLMLETFDTANNRCQKERAKARGGARAKALTATDRWSDHVMATATNTTRRALFAGALALTAAAPAIAVAAAAAPPTSPAAAWAKACEWRQELNATADNYSEEAFEAECMKQGKLELFVAEAPIRTRQDAAAKVHLALDAFKNGMWTNGADIRGLEQVARWLEAI